MNLPTEQFIQDNTKNYKQSLAVKKSNAKNNSYNSKNKIRKQILLTYNANTLLDKLAAHYKLSNSSIIEFCLNEFYLSTIKGTGEITSQEMLLSLLSTPFGQQKYDVIDIGLQILKEIRK